MTHTPETVGRPNDTPKKPSGMMDMAKAAMEILNPKADPRLDKLERETSAALKELRENPQTDIAASLLDEGLGGLTTDLNEVGIKNPQEVERYRQEYKSYFHQKIGPIEEQHIADSMEAEKLTAFVTGFAAKVEWDQVVKKFEKTPGGTKGWEAKVSQLREKHPEWVPMMIAVLEWLNKDRKDEKPTIWDGLIATLQKEPSQEAQGRTDGETTPEKSGVNEADAYKDGDNTYQRVADGQYKDQNGAIYKRVERGIYKSENGGFLITEDAVNAPPGTEVATIMDGGTKTVETSGGLPNTQAYLEAMGNRTPMDLHTLQGSTGENPGNFLFMVKGDDPKARLAAITQWINEKTAGNAGELIAITPDAMTFRQEDGTEVKVNVSRVKDDEFLLTRPNEKEGVNFNGMPESLSEAMKQLSS